MTDSSDQMREWAAAERMAIQAEEMLRAAVQRHIEHGTALPSMEMQQSAAELRRKADDMFRGICESARTGRSP